MNKLIRVILSLDPTGFAAGVLTANNALQLLQMAITAVVRAGEFLYNTFIKDAAIQEQYATRLGILMGTTQQASQFFDQLGQATQGWGVNLDETKAAVGQLALGLKAMDGAVDPSKLMRMTEVTLELGKATGRSSEEVAHAITRAMTTGNWTMIGRELGINLETVKGLSKEAQDVLQKAQGASNTALGSVTSIMGKDVKPSSDQALNALEEVIDKLGIGKSAMEKYGNTFDGQIMEITNLWNEFKDTFGQSFISDIMPALKAFVEYLIAHKADIEAFATKLADFTAQGVIEMADALEKVDWKAIGDVMARIGTGIAVPGTIAGQVQSVGGVGGLATGLGNMALPGVAGAGQAAGQVARDALNTSQALPNALMQLLGGGGVSLSGLAGIPQQNVNITLTVDEQGHFQIRNIAKQEAAAATRDLVHSVTSGTSGSNSRTHHGAQ